MRALTPGTVLASTYRLGARVRRGRFGGQVWRGWTVDSQRRVTLVFRPDDEDAGQLARRFLIISAVQHPHLATPIDHGVDGVPYLAYEGLEGETLAAATPRGRFTVQDTLRLAGQLLAALDAAHARGLVHGALDADSVFLIQRSFGVLSPKILGFGLDAGPGRTPADDVAAVAGVLAAIVDGIVAAATPDSDLPDELAPLLARAAEGDPDLATAAALRLALEETGSPQRRPRTGRDARVVLATAPSMKRAMHDVLLQTSEHAAIPCDLALPALPAPPTPPTPIERAHTGRSPRPVASQPLVPTLPSVRVAASDAATGESGRGVTPPEAEAVAVAAIPAGGAERGETLIGQPRVTAADLVSHLGATAAHAATADTLSMSPAQAIAPLADPDPALLHRSSDDASGPSSGRNLDIASQYTRPSDLADDDGIATPEWAAPPRRQRRRTDPSRPTAHIERPTGTPPEHELSQPAREPGAAHTHLTPDTRPTATGHPRQSEPGVPAPTVEVPMRGGHVQGSEARVRPGPPSWVAAAVFAVLAVLILLTLADRGGERPDAAGGGEAAPSQVGVTVPGGEQPPGSGPSDHAARPEPGPPEAAVTRLTLRSTPSDAVVSHAGAVLGRTPIDLEVPAGSHRFDLAAPGYRPLSVSVEGRGSQSLTHDLILEPLRSEPGPSPAPPTP